MEEIREKKKINVINICLVVSYIALAVGLFLLIYRYQVVDKVESCNPASGACVESTTGVHNMHLVDPIISWIIIGISLAAAIALNVVNVISKRKKKEENQVE